MYEKYASQILENETKIGNEYYVSLIYNLMVEQNKKIALHEVEKFICWGTPEDLEQYYFWSEFFGRSGSRIKNRKFL